MFPLVRGEASRHSAHEARHAGAPCEPDPSIWAHVWRCQLFYVLADRIARTVQAGIIETQFQFHLGFAIQSLFLGGALAANRIWDLANVFNQRGTRCQKPAATVCNISFCNLDGQPHRSCKKAHHIGSMVYLRQPHWSCNLLAGTPFTKKRVHAAGKHLGNIQELWPAAHQRCEVGAYAPQTNLFVAVVLSKGNPCVV